MKSLSLLAAALISAPVIKATPPLPPYDVSTKSYSDIQMTLIDKYDDEDSASGNGKSYKIHVKNTGKGYVKYFSLGFPKETPTGSHFSSYKTETPFVSKNSVLAPGQELNIVISANYDTNNLDDFIINADAYVDFFNDVYAYGSFTLTSEKNTINPDIPYLNRVDMHFDAENNRFCYGAIIRINDEGTYSYFEVDLQNNFSFYSEAPLVAEGESKEVELVKILRTEYSHYSEHRVLHETLPIILIVAPILGLFLIIGLIATIVFAVYGKRKNR